MSPSAETALPEILILAEDDPRRAEIEVLLQAADLAELRALWRRNRAAAAAARRAGDMAAVILLVRGSKTIQRIADMRGAIFAADR